MFTAGRCLYSRYPGPGLLLGQPDMQDLAGRAASYWVCRAARRRVLLTAACSRPPPSGPAASSSRSKKASVRVAAAAAFRTPRSAGEKPALVENPTWPGSEGAAVSLV